MAVASDPRERAFWLAWSKVPGIGPILLMRLLERFGSLSTAWQAPEIELASVQGIGTQVLRAVGQFRSKTNPTELLQQHEQQNSCFWTPADPGYPRLLREIPDRPAVIYYRGEVRTEETQAQTPLVAIVGTREPSSYGKRWASKLSTVLVNNGFTVISGMAEGIDTEAHQACLQAGGRTIGVLGTGVDVIYPIRNQALYGQMVQQGWVMSEYPAGTQPDRVHFPRRNRLIAAMSRATIVVEAPTKSGALITAHMANDYGRDVFVLPGSLDNPRSLGCLGLLSKGAQVILGEGHLLDLLGSIPVVEPVVAPSGTSLNPSHDETIQNLSPPLRQVLDCLSDEATSVDQIVQQSGLTAAVVSGLLLELELYGLITQTPGMRYQRL
jgi:DNA processing protein